MSPGEESRFAGVRIPTPASGTDDDGTAAPEVEAALAGYAAGEHGYARVLATVCDARLLVPVVAVAEEAVTDDRGRARDKSSDMAAVLLRGQDGRAGLLAFTGVSALQAWDPAARPVPVTSRDAARAARQDGAAALVVDVAGPVRLVVEGDDLDRVASGDRLVAVGEGYGWIRPGTG